jgi:hypothetical protein
MVDALLQSGTVGQPLADFLADQREAGLSWKEIAKQLASLTDGVVDVSWMTVKRWDDLAKKASA